MDNGAGSYRRFRDGDDDGLVEIIKEYKDSLIFYINGFVGDLHTAEDLAEETFVKLATKKPRFSGKSSFKTWLYSIGRNVAIDFLKHRAKANEVQLDESISLSDTVNFESNFLKEERKVILHRAMQKLRPEYRQVLNLVYFEDFSNKEVAAVIKKSVHNAEMLVCRARQALKTELEKEDFVYEDL